MPIESSAAGRPNFEIGLVMAGAVSAGAYTGGVIDFLIQALDEWQRAKDAWKPGDPPVPMHDIELKVMTGSSAGSITAAIATAALASEFPPVTDLKEPGIVANKLFDSWVNLIDISSLLLDSDLADEHTPVRSLLDSTVLQSIADLAMDVKGDRIRPYVGNPLHVVTTVANLRGVPYNIGFNGQVRGGHDIFLHADYFQFAVSDRGATPVPGALTLDWQKSDPRFAPAWATLKAAALASSAFPIGLSPRRLTYRCDPPPGDPYSQRVWPIPTPGRLDAQGRPECLEYKPIRPNWPASLKFPLEYEFLCVDGGLMNNEPMELARQLLAGADLYNPRGANDAKRGLIMIDPFPAADTDVGSYEIKEDLVSVALGMFGALKNQARFKPDELELAQDPHVFSRFLIAPTRTLPNGEPADHPIASGTLGGFGGFFSRDFRVHDFIAGRRNCQRFLQRYFNLGEHNHLFDDWDPALKASDAHRVVEDGEAFLPIIPLLGTARAEVKALPWPSFTRAQLAKVEEQISGRYNAVADRLIRQVVGDKWVLRQVAKFVVRQKRGDVLKMAVGKLQQDLVRFGLLQ